MGQRGGGWSVLIVCELSNDILGDSHTTRADQYNAVSHYKRAQALDIACH